jgi:hypothetical protein
VLLGARRPAFAVRPLVEWDGWAIWAMKARAPVRLRRRRPRRLHHGAVRAAPASAPASRPRGDRLSARWAPSTEP